MLLIIDAFIKIYGSLATSLVYKYSDLDLAVCGLNIRSQEELKFCITSLNSVFEKSPLVISSNPIPTATVPIISLVHNL